MLIKLVIKNGMGWKDNNKLSLILDVIQNELNLCCSLSKSYTSARLNYSPKNKRKKSNERQRVVIFNRVAAEH